MANGIETRKVTHTRGYTVKTAQQHRASADDAKALGHWSESGSYHKSYDTALPTDAMLAAASFNAQKQESYFIARDILGMAFFRQNNY